MINRYVIVAVNQVRNRSGDQFYADLSKTLWFHKLTKMLSL